MYPVLQNLKQLNPFCFPVPVSGDRIIQTLVTHQLDKQKITILIIFEKSNVKKASFILYMPAKGEVRILRLFLLKSAAGENF